MSQRIRTGVRRTLLMVAAAAAAGVLAYSQQATAEDQQEGRVVNISPDGNAPAVTADDSHATSPTTEEARSAAPTYWLGIQGQPIDSAILRTHLQLADDVGIVVENVMDHSPAEKAGLRRHDILIAVGGEPITDMAMLQKAVAASAGKAIELKYIRLAKEETVSITPEERPAHLAAAMPQNADVFGGAMPGMQMGQMGDVQKMLEQMQQQGAGFRVFGPGMVMNGVQAGAMQIPGGVRLSVTREGNGPASITISKGDQTWTVKTDDAEAIKNLPNDIRPLVEQAASGQMLGGGGLPNLPNLGDLPRLPRQLGRVHQFGIGGDDANQQLQDRMEQLEKQIEQLQKQVSGDHSHEGTNPSAEPSNH